MAPVVMTRGELGEMARAVADEPGLRRWEGAAAGYAQCEVAAGRAASVLDAVCTLAVELPSPWREQCLREWGLSAKLVDAFVKGIGALGGAAPKRKGRN